MEGSRWIKASAIITHLQDERLARLVQSQINLTRTRMFDRVMQGLLRDPVEVLFDLERKIRLCAQLSVHRYILPRLQSRRLFAECGHQLERQRRCICNAFRNV